jgi:hypothetical protein
VPSRARPPEQVAPAAPGSPSLRREALAERGLLHHRPGYPGPFRFLRRGRYYPDRAVRDALIAELRASSGQSRFDEQMLILHSLVEAAKLNKYQGLTFERAPKAGLGSRRRTRGTPSRRPARRQRVTRLLGVDELQPRRLTYPPGTSMSPSCRGSAQRMPRWAAHRELARSAASVMRASARACPGRRTRRRYRGRRWSGGRTPWRRGDHRDATGC